MSRIKKISASVMALMLVLCIGYFSLMSPTSAWFYESGVIDSGDSFVFGNLSVDAKFNTSKNIVLDGATKLADSGEKLFDSVVNVNKIVVTNSGSIPARLYANVIGANSKNGLNWFFYSDKMIVNNSVKETISSVLPKLTADELKTYNVGADGQSGKYFLVQPGEKITVYIAVWAEYDSVATTLESGSAINADIDLELIATQNKDGAVKR